jgi:integrase
MLSRTPKGRASKGSVSILSSNNRLQLQFQYAGKRHYLSMGLPDTKDARKVAEMRAREIELDILCGNFDATLQKYKPQSALSTSASDINLKIVQTPALNELWEKFVEYKRPQCSANTMHFVYGHFTTYIEKLPTYDLSRAAEIRDFSLQTFPLDSCKRFITRLCACGNWAVESGRIASNPFQGMASQIKLPKAQKKDEDEDIDPFTQEEREAILQALKDDTYRPKRSAFKHSFYYSYTKFLFSTGCRPSEAIALQWKHISDDFRFVRFEQAMIETNKGRILREGLKTQERRRFPCNEQLQNFLKEIKPLNCDSETFVFPGYKGGYLDNKSFRKSIWKTVLAGLNIEYRKPYQTRHTFITLALEHGLDAKDVARLVGNSPEVIYRHYAGNKRDLIVPEF